MGMVLLNHNIATHAKTESSRLTCSNIGVCPTYDRSKLKSLSACSFMLAKLSSFAVSASYLLNSGEKCT